MNWRALVVLGACLWCAYVTWLLLREEWRGGQLRRRLDILLVQMTSDLQETDCYPPAYLDAVKHYAGQLEEVLHANGND